MNAKLTPGILLIALLAGTVVGPATTLSHGVTSDQLTSASYWLDLAAAAITSFGGTIVAEIAVVGSALGLPMYQSARAASNAAAAPTGGTNNASPPA